MQDNADPWGMSVRRFRKAAGTFKLMSRAAGTRFSGVTAGTLPSVRVIEDGPVRSVVEALFSFADSFICQRYKLPRQGTEIEVETRVHWNEKDRMLKLSIPTRIPEATYCGQVAYGVAELPDNGDEVVAQKWVAVVSKRHDMALTCINDRTYGSDMSDGEVRLSLLRAPAHSGHPTDSGRPIVQQGRYTPRIDQGEHVFRFWLNAGSVVTRLARIDREALTRNERPMALSLSPAGSGVRPPAGVVLSGETVQMTVFKQAEDGRDLIIRLFEPTGRKRSTTLALPFARVRKKVTLRGFEIKTLRFKLKARRFAEVDLLERPVRGQGRG
jgi:alpha-mannosidase